MENTIDTPPTPVRERAATPLDLDNDPIVLFLEALEEWEAEQEQRASERGVYGPNE